jgi:hypothetical protein
MGAFSTSMRPGLAGKDTYFTVNKEVPSSVL